MRYLLSALLSFTAFAQTLVVTSADSRCTGSPMTCTFVSPELQPADYAANLTFTLSGGGTWTFGAESPTTCASKLFGWHRQGVAGVDYPPSPVITTVSASGTVFLGSEIGVAGACAPGTYTHTIPITNGGATYTITLIQKVVPRLAGTVIINNCGVTDASMAGAAQGNCSGGLTDAAGQANTAHYYLNQVPCPTCSPGGSFVPPAPGGTFIDDFGYVHTVLTPSGWNNPSDTQKLGISYNGTWILANSLGADPALYLNGSYAIFPSAGATAPTFIVPISDIGNSTSTWDEGDDSVLWGIYEAGQGNPANSIVKKIRLNANDANCTGYTVSGTYSRCTGPGYSAGSGTMYSFDRTTYGRLHSTGLSHQDQNRAGWYGSATSLDWFGQVTITGNQMTWVSGTLFDVNRFLDQAFVVAGTANSVVSSCASTTTCTLSTSPGNVTNAAAFANIPLKLCVFNLPQITAQGASYVPVCGDIGTLPRPRPAYIAGVTYISIAPAADGYLYIWSGNIPNGFTGWFRPGVDTTITLGAGLIYMSPYVGSLNGSTCVPSDSTPFLSGGGSFCVQTPHATSYMTSDGKQWLVGDGNFMEGYEMSHFNPANGPFVPFPANTYTGSLFAANIGGNEIGSARDAPYLLTSLSALSAIVPWAVSGCTATNGSPIIVTLTAASPTVFNTTTHNKILIGGVWGSTICNGHKTITAVAGANNNILTLSQNGDGSTFNGSSFAEAVEDAAINPWGAADVDQMLLLRDYSEVRRFGHTRAVSYNDAFSYVTNSRASLSRCADKIIYTTNFGIPGGLYMVSVPTGVNGCGQTPSMFDGSGHSVTSAVMTGPAITINYTAPDNGSSIVEVGQTRRFADTPGGSSPDASYQTLTQSGGSATRTAAFTGAAGQQYYYRIVHGNKAVASGALGALAAAGSAGSRGVILRGGVLRRS